VVAAVVEVDWPAPGFVALPKTSERLNWTGSLQVLSTTPRVDELSRTFETPVTRWSRTIVLATAYWDTAQPESDSAAPAELAPEAEPVAIALAASDDALGFEAFSVVI
jgi:hypothetical protein